MKLLIKMTEEVLRTTALCGQGGFKLESSNSENVDANCAVTYACRKLFPIMRIIKLKT